MPKKISTVEKVSKDQQRMHSLVAWSEIIPNIGTKDKSALISFGRRYGVVAMAKRAKSLITDRHFVSKAHIDKIKAKIDFLVGMHSVWSSTVVAKQIPQKVVVARKKRSEFVRGFAERAEPMVRSMLTLAFTSKVLEVYLSREEIVALTGVTHKPSDLIKLQSLIEHRSGSTIERLMKSIQVEVENDFVQMWAANIKDGQILANNPEYASKYQKALESGNVSELASFFMKGIQ